MWVLACPHIRVPERWAGERSPTTGTRNLSVALHSSEPDPSLSPLVWHSQSHTCLSHFWWMLAFAEAGAGRGDVAGQGREGGEHHLYFPTSGAGRKMMIFS